MLKIAVLVQYRLDPRWLLQDLSEVPEAKW